MAFNQLSAEELTRLRALLGQSPAPSTSITPAPSQAPSAPPQQIPAPGSSGPILPIAQLYTSARLPSSGHPSSLASGPSVSSFQPFLGIGSLNPSLATGHVNRARLALASTTIPRQAVLACCGRRRGPALHPPTLPRTSPEDVSSCLAPNGDLQLTVKVIFSIEKKGNSEYYLYRFLRDSLNGWLEQHSLLFRFEVPVSEAVHDTISRVASLMRGSLQEYRFQSSSHSHLIALHETLPLQVLSLVNRGLPRPKDQQIRLIPHPVGPHITISTLMQDKNKFASPLCLEGGRLVLHLTVALTGLSFKLDGRRHSCLGKRFSQLFASDSQYGLVRDIYEDEDGSSGGEYLTDDEDQAAPGLPAERPADVLVSHPSQPLRRDQSLSSLTNFLPPRIWDESEPWVPEPQPAHTQFTIDTLTADVYRAANAGAAHRRLTITGASVAAMATALDTVIGYCVDNENFSTLLSDDREFRLLGQDGLTLSFGPGIEREVMFAAFQAYRDSSSQWFNMRADGLATLQTLQPFGSRFVSQQRIRAVKKLGALVGLLMANAQCPSPLDPCIFQFIVHNANLHALHPTVVREWHTDLRLLIAEWNRIGPDADISAFQGHLATYHDIQASSFADRDLELHQALAGEMLYRTILGPEPPYHQEWQAFSQGFSLPCPNGFRFTNVPRQFAGGSESFFSLIWTSSISSFDSLKPYLTISHSASLNSWLSDALGEPADLEELIFTFLQNTGIPCPQLFDEVQEHFSPLIDFSQVGHAGFRSRMLAWAATGSPSIDPGAQAIEISTAEISDMYFAGTNSNIRAMAREGTVSFRTCTRAVRLPRSYLLELARASYNDHSKAPSFQAAFEHWLFSEILNAIGGHSML